MSPSRDTLHCNATPAGLFRLAESLREVFGPKHRFLQLLATNDFRHLRARRAVVRLFVALTEGGVSCGHGYALGIGLSHRRRRLNFGQQLRQLRYVRRHGRGSSARFASVPSTRRPIQNWSRKVGQIRPSRVRRAMLSSSAPRIVFGRKGLNEPLSTATTPSPGPCAILRISKRSRRTILLLRSMTSSP